MNAREQWWDISSLTSDLAQKLLFLHGEKWTEGHNSAVEAMQDQIEDAQKKSYEAGLADGRANRFPPAVACSVEVLRAAIEIDRQYVSDATDKVSVAARKYLTDLFEGKP